MRLQKKAKHIQTSYDMSHKTSTYVGKCLIPLEILLIDLIIYLQMCYLLPVEAQTGKSVSGSYVHLAFTTSICIVELSF